jgi:hypothetical protein
MWPFGWRVHPTIEIGVCADQPVTRARIFVDLSLTGVGSARKPLAPLSFKKICIKIPPLQISTLIWVRFRILPGNPACIWKIVGEFFKGTVRQRIIKINLDNRPAQVYASKALVKYRPGFGWADDLRKRVPARPIVRAFLHPRLIASDQNFLKGSSNEYRHCKMVQHPAGFWLYPA